MSPLELDEFTKILEKTLLERYEKSLERCGKLKSLYLDADGKNDSLARNVQKLTTSNKKLTNQLAKANESLEYYKKTTVFQNNVITRAREISPEVCARINEILNEEYALSQTNQ